MKKLLLLCFFLLFCFSSVHALERINFQIIGDSGFNELALMNIKVKCHHFAGETTYYLPDTNQFGVSKGLLPLGMHKCTMTAMTKEGSTRKYYTATRYHNIQKIGKNHIVLKANFNDEKTRSISQKYPDAVVLRFEESSPELHSRLVITTTVAVALAVTTAGFIAWDAYNLYDCMVDPDLVDGDCMDEAAFLAANFVPGALFVKAGKFIFKGGKIILNVPMRSSVINGFKNYAGDVVMFVKSSKGGILVYEFIEVGGKKIQKVFETTSAAFLKVSDSFKQKLIPKVIPGVEVRVGGQTLVKESCGNNIGDCKGLIGELTLIEYIQQFKNKLGDNVVVEIKKGRKKELLAETSEYRFIYGDTPYSVKVRDKKTSFTVAEFDGVFVIQGKLVIGEAKVSNYDTAYSKLIERNQLERTKEYGDILAKELDEVVARESEVLLLLSKDTYQEGMREEVGQLVKSNNWLHVDSMPLTTNDYERSAVKVLKN